MKYSKEMRKKAGLTQSQLAEMVGITRAYLSRVDMGAQEFSADKDALACSICEHYGSKKTTSATLSIGHAQGDAISVIGNTSSVNINNSAEPQDKSLLERIAALEADVSQLKSAIINIMNKL